MAKVSPLSHFDMPTNIDSETNPKQLTWMMISSFTWSMIHALLTPCSWSWRMVSKILHLWTKCCPKLPTSCRMSVGLFMLQKSWRVSGVCRLRNNELKIVRSLLSVPEAKLQLVPTCQQLSTYERNILEELTAILTPFEEATDFTQGQNSVTVSFVIQCIRVSLIQLLKWLLVSLNTERLHSASTDMASRVHTNTSKILMFGQESGSANTKDFSNASSQSALLDCLDHLLNHLDTTLSNDLGVIRSLCHYSNCSGGGIPSLIIKDGTRLRKALTGQQLSAEKWYCNCCSKLSIKWMSIYLL